jgi:hypothetical protein
VSATAEIGKAMASADKIVILKCIVPPWNTD